MACVSGVVKMYQASCHFTTKPAAEGSALALNLDFEDEIINGSAVTHAGAKRNGGAK